jgi:hypothetical protein
MEGIITQVRDTLEVPVSCDKITDVCTELSGSVAVILYGIFCHLSITKYVVFERRFPLQV